MRVIWMINPGAIIRRKGFWAVNAIKGGLVRKHFNDISYILENPNDPDSFKIRDKYLNDILRHAIRTTVHYKNLPLSAALNDFPVVNKEIIRADTSSFISDIFERKKLYGVTTSGSTGTPFKVFKDTNKLARHQAENIYFNEIAGFTLGTRLYYLRVWNEINRKGLFKRISQNLVMQDADDISFQKMEDLFRTLANDSQTKTILAFASTCEGIVRYLDTTGMNASNLGVCVIITISETLPDQTKIRLREAFGCPVISRYSNIENGFLAQQCISENNEYHINTASFHIELLDLDTDKSVRDGSLGRVVVTDLFNYGMPLIRYDTGDIAIRSEKSACSDKTPIFTRIEGRRVDFIYNTSGNLLSPHVVTNTMWKYPVRQFQFIQEGEKNYRMRLNCDFKKLPDERNLIQDLNGYLGSDAIIDIEYVDEIPLLASGKRKKIVNNYRL